MNSSSVVYRSLSSPVAEGRKGSLTWSFATTKVRPGHVQAVLDALSQKGLAPRTAIQARAVLNGAMKSAVAWGFIESNPVQAVKPPKPERAELEVPTPKQLIALINVAKGTVWEIPVLISGTTGSRRSETMGLSWEGLDLTSGTMRITQTLQKGERGRPSEFLAPKTHRSRRAISLHPAVVQRLRSYRQEQLERRLAKGSEWIDLNLVCDRGDGGAHDPDQFSKNFKKLAAKAGLHPDTRLHDVRHAVATALLEQGVDTAITAAILGHSNPAFTAHVYQHVSTGMTDQGAKALGDALGL